MNRASAETYTFGAVFFSKACDSIYYQVARISRASNQQAKMTATLHSALSTFLLPYVLYEQYILFV